MPDHHLRESNRLRASTWGRGSTPDFDGASGGAVGGVAASALGRDPVCGDVAALEQVVFGAGYTQRRQRASVVGMRWCGPM